MTKPDCSADMAAEQALVARARDGDGAAFRELVERYEDLVAATVTGMLGPGPEADDVGQQTFIRFYEALGQYRGEGGVAPYLTRVAINLSLNALDRRQRWHRRFLSRDARGGLPDPATEGPAPAFDRHELVQRALHHLSPKHRAVIVLRLIDGYSTRETADLLGVPLGTVLSRLARAQRALKDLLGPYLEDA
ncbi:MAG: RNA polymerase sigma factor [Rhodothermales bacterium]